MADDTTDQLNTQLAQSRDRITSMLAQSAQVQGDPVTNALFSSYQIPGQKRPSFSDALNSQMANRIAAEESLYKVLSTQQQAAQTTRRLDLEERGQNIQAGWHAANLAQKASEQGDKEAAKALDVFRTIYGDLTEQSDKNGVASKYWRGIKDYTDSSGGQAPDVPTLFQIASKAGAGMDLQTKKSADVEARQQQIANTETRLGQLGAMVGIAQQNLELNRSKFEEQQKQNEQKAAFKERDLSLKEKESESRIAYKEAQTAKIQADMNLTPAMRTKMQEAINDASLGVSRISGMREIIANNGDRMLGAQGKLKDFFARTGGQISTPSTDPEVEEARTRLMALNESLIRTIARNPSRPSNQSAAEIQRMLVSPGTWESRERAISVLNGLEKYLQETVDWDRNTLTKGVMGNKGQSGQFGNSGWSITPKGP